MNEKLLSRVRGRKGHFKLESGHHGDLWFQLETLCLDSRAIQPLAARLAARLVPLRLKNCSTAGTLLVKEWFSRPRSRPFQECGVWLVHQVFIGLQAMGTGMDSKA